MAGNFVSSFAVFHILYYFLFIFLLPPFRPFLNVIGILSSRETSKMLLSWKTKTHILLTCSNLVVFYGSPLVPKQDIYYNG